MTLPPFLVTILLFVIIVNFVMHFKRKDYTKGINKFIKEETEANDAPQRPIPQELFYDAKADKLQFRDDFYGLDAETSQKLMQLQDRVKQKSELKMLHFNEKYTNVELKMRYGATSISKIVMLEEHFSQYMFALCEWGEFLYKLDDKSAAESVFAVCVNAHCDISKPYLHLADIYFRQKNRSKFETLISELEHSNIPAKSGALEQIKEIFNRL